MLKLIYATVITVSALFLESAHAQSRFGRYTGVFQNEILQQNQVAKLDFIMSRQEANELKLTAILNIFLGDFESSEYVSYHFDNVRYNIVTGTLVFDQPEQDLTLVVSGFSGTTLTGEMRSAMAGNVGKLVLTQGDEAVVTNPLVQPVWGEYRGRCGSHTKTLQIQTARSTEAVSNFGDPFGAYKMTGQLADSDVDDCMNLGDACVQYIYDSGSYDFFTGDLNLYGRSDDLACKVTSTGLDCNGCQLNRRSHEPATGSRFSFRRTNAAWSSPPEPGRGEAAINDSSDSIQGQYTGYVYHESLGRYQAASFNLIATPDSQNSQLIMSAVATLYFGEHDSRESITYRFDERPYNLLSPQVVFEGIARNTDAILQVTKIAGGEVQGIWYSLIYGRVGTFLLRKGTPPTLPRDALRIESIAGKYEGPNWAITLRVARDGAQGDSKNPFFPLNFRGHARLEPQVTANIPIAGGSYDFYTGKISINLNDGTSFLGQRPSRRKLLLKRPTPGIMRLLIDHDPLVYRLTGP